MSVFIRRDLILVYLILLNVKYNLSGFARFTELIVKLRNRWFACTCRGPLARLCALRWPLLFFHPCVDGFTFWLIHASSTSHSVLPPPGINLWRLLRICLLVVFTAILHGNQQKFLAESLCSNMSHTWNTISDITWSRHGMVCCVYEQTRSNISFLCLVPWPQE